MLELFSQHYYHYYCLSDVQPSQWNWNFNVASNRVMLAGGLMSHKPLKWINQSDNHHYSQLQNLEIKLDTNSGKLWFGNGESFKLIASNLLKLVHGNSGFTFCCSLTYFGECVEIVDFEKIL